MFYKLLGMVVWKAGNWYVRRRFGAKPLVAAGIALAAAAGVALAAKQLASGDDE
jgi:hypothetical protein